MPLLLSGCSTQRPTFDLARADGICDPLSLTAIVTTGGAQHPHPLPCVSASGDRQIRNDVAPGPTGTIFSVSFFPDPDVVDYSEYGSTAGSATPTTDVLPGAVDRSLLLARSAEAAVS